MCPLGISHKLVIPQRVEADVKRVEERVLPERSAVRTLANRCWRAQGLAAWIVFVISAIAVDVEFAGER